MPNGYFVGGFIVENAKPGTITITGTTGTYSSSEDPNVNTSHGQCGAGIGDRLDSFTVTVTIDENGNIVTGGSDNGDSGKTDNGSASNAPATKNTSGTPKTGDITTVPAVAVGLTLTAAGVVAFISKRKKYTARIIFVFELKTAAGWTISCGGFRYANFFRNASGFCSIM